MRLTFLGERLTMWEEHWSNGGTGVTKLPASSETSDPVIKSVADFGDPAIFIVEKPGGDCEMHCTRDTMDLSDFWEFHRTNTAE